MRLVIQRVAAATVTINGQVKASIANGLLVLVGIEEADVPDDIEWLCTKITNMRLFNDKSGIMNLSVKDVAGEILVVSQFTLQASTKKGNRPSYLKAAKSEIALPLYNQFITTLQEIMRVTNKAIQTGTFGADMKVSLLNDGPVTIYMDSKNRE